MSFVQFIRILWARRLIIIIATLGCFLTAVAIAKLLPPRYEASTRIMMDLMKPDPVTGQVMSAQGAGAYAQAQSEIIQDYRVAGKVADAAGWQTSPDLAAEYQQSGRTNDMDFRRWLAQKVIDSTEAGLVPGSSIMEITYSSTRPETAAAMADMVREVYIEEARNTKRSEASRNAEWFESQTEKLKIELAAAEKAKNEFERANGIVLDESGMDTDNARLAALAGASQAPQINIPGASGPIITPSSQQLAQIDSAISVASDTLGPNHPDIKQLREQRSSVAAAAAKELAAVRASQRPAARGPSVGALLSQQQAKVLAKSGQVGEAKRLATNVAVLRDQYLKTSGRAAELNLEAQSDETGMTLLGSAVPPQAAAFPKVPLITFGSLGFGLALGILTALLVELLNRRIRAVEDLEMLNLPILGAMAHGSADKKPGFFKRLFSRGKNRFNPALEPA